MRLKNIDVLRGIVMILMCIDHARDYTLFHPTSPMDLSNTPFIVFLLRILANFCAPTFILLAGLSARLYGRNKTKQQLSKFLLSRGIVLCILELTLVNWAWDFNPFYKLYYLQVIWALGISMIFLSALIWMRSRYILLVALVIIGGHNLLDHVHFEKGTAMHYVWSFFLEMNILPITDHLSVRTTYPVLPVIAVMALGYIVGLLYTNFDAMKRKTYLMYIGMSSFALFLILRIFVGYGDSSPFEVSSDPLMTFMSLFNLTKYPLSFQFNLYALSFTFLFLAFTEKMNVKDNNLFLILGRTPMFFYILHLYVLHSIALIAVICSGLKPDFVNYLGGIPPQFGIPLWWLLWIIPFTVLSLSFLCKRYYKLKLSKKYSWTSYI